MLPASLFISLFANDTGADYPSPTANGDAYPADCPFRPFVWAQWLAGLRILPSQKPSALEPSSRMVLQRVRAQLVDIFTHLTSCVWLDS